MEFVLEHAFTLAVLAALLVAGGALFFDRRRRAAIEELAAAQGLQYSPDGPEPRELEATGLELFRLGHSRRARSMIQIPARAGLLRVFDYRYFTGSGRGRSVNAFTVALAACPGRQVPRFDLKPESFLHKLGEFAGFGDIDLPEYPEFSGKYRLTGPDEAAVTAYFNPVRVAWFENHQGLRVQGAAGWLLLNRREGELPAAEWEGFIEEARAFAAETL